MMKRTRRRLNTLREMSRLAGIQEKELRAEAEAGTLPHVRVGKRGLLFDPELVLATLEARARSAVSADRSEVADAS